MFLLALMSQRCNFHSISLLIPHTYCVHIPCIVNTHREVCKTTGAFSVLVTVRVVQACHEARRAVERIYCTTGSGAVNEQVRKTNNHSSASAKNTTLLCSGPVSRAQFVVTLIACLNQSDFPIYPRSPLTK